MIYNLKKYRAINKFLTIDWNSNRYYNESIYRNLDAGTQTQPHQSGGCFAGRITNK